MASRTIEVDIGGKTITLDGTIITILRSIPSDTYISLNGIGGNVKFGYNSTTKRIEFYIEGELVGSYAKNVEEDPFR